MLAEGEDLLSLASDAAEGALADAGVAPSEIDQVLVATMSHDRLTPSLAPLLADRIGALEAGALDVGAACTGFVKALAMAAGQIEAGRAEASSSWAPSGSAPWSTATTARPRRSSATGRAAVVRPGSGARLRAVRARAATASRAEMVRTERDEA